MELNKFKNNCKHFINIDNNAIKEFEIKFFFDNDSCNKHIIKHIIKEKNLLKNTFNKEIKETRAQLEKIRCNYLDLDLDNINNKKYCLECQQQNYCKKIIKKLKDNYIKIGNNLIEQENLANCGYRHLHFIDSKSDIETIYILSDEMILAVLTKKKNNSFVLLTIYRVMLNHKLNHHGLKKFDAVKNYINKKAIIKSKTMPTYCIKKNW